MLKSSNGFSFRYNEKLHLQRDFNKTLKNGKRITTSFVNIFVLNRNDGNTIRRLGLITSGKVGTAVERNTAKRRLREIFRTNKHKLTQGLDIIFILKPQIRLTKYSEIKETVIYKLQKAGFYNEAINI